MTGDWLSKLAITYLGDVNRWHEIYNANQSVIEAAAHAHGYPNSRGGDLIFPGTVLAIPGAACPVPPPTTTADCSKGTFFLGVRGSGENPPADTSAFGLGREIHSVYTHLTALNPDVGVAGIPYQAAPVPRVWDPIGLGAFTGSAIRGGNLLREAIERQAACHNQKIVLAGYSQGALAIHLALAQLPAELRARISGIVLVGDPVVSRGGLLGRLAIPPIPEELRSRTESYCLSGDPVCNPEDRAHEILEACTELRPTCTHLQYSQPPSPGVPSETEKAARFLNSASAG